MIEVLEAELAQPLEARTKRATKNADKRKTENKSDVFGIAGEEASGKKTPKSGKPNKDEKPKNGAPEKTSPAGDGHDEKAPTPKE